MPTEALVTPDLLVWSRETAGLSLDGAAHLLRVSSDHLASWERGERRPTIGRVRKMAQIYKRPLNVFFLPTRPEADDEPQIPDFRATEDGIPRHRSRAVHFALRRMHDWRLDVLDLLRESGVEPSPFQLQASIRSDAEEVASQVRRHIGISLEDQTAWSRHDRYVAFNAWRDRIENLGVLVFQVDRVETTEFRGASVFHDVLPVILLNSADAPNGRIFTTLHELTHLALKGSGLCEPQLVRPGQPRADPIEIFCNAVAGAVLVPEGALLSHPLVEGQPGMHEWPEDVIAALANHFSVSRHVVLRRLLRFGRASARFYELKQREWSVQRGVRAEGGGDGRRTNLSARGRTYARLVLSAYGAERITLYEAARYLGLKAPDIGMAREYAAR